MTEIWKDIKDYEELGLHDSNITHVLKDRYKQTGGYTFKYLNEGEINNEPKL